MKIQYSNIVFIILLRVCLLIISRQFVQADEYWQGTEMVYELVYGGVYKAWEWDSCKPIRSIIFPIIYSPITFLLKVLNIKNHLLISNSPYLVQFALSILSDYFFIKITEKIMSFESQRLSFYLYLLCPYTLIYNHKIFSNTLEEFLLLMLLWMYSLTKYHNAKYFFIPFFSVLMFWIRPNSAINCFFINLFTLKEILTVKSLRLKRIMLIILSIFLSLSILIICDFLYFKKFSLIQYNFFLFNILQNKSSQFGVEEWHSYILYHIPHQIGLVYLFCILGIILCIKRIFTNKYHFLFILILFSTIGMYSAISHKENRFILPIIPLLILYSGFAFKFLIKVNIFGWIFKLIYIACLFHYFYIWIFLLFNKGNTSSAFSLINYQIPKNENITIGVFVECYSNQHYSLLTPHKILVPNCIPGFVREESEDKFGTNSQLYLDYLESYPKKTNYERLDYIIIDEFIFKTENDILLNILFKYYDLVDIIKVNPPSIFELVLMKNQTYFDLTFQKSIYLFKSNPNYILIKNIK